MVYEARPGQTFLLGASTWRIEEIGRDRVIVTPAPGRAGRRPVLEGRQRRTAEGARRGDRRVRPHGARACRPRSSSADYDLDPLAARNLLEFLREQQDATRVIPSDRTIVVERFRDEIGDWRLCVLSPYGGRVHAAWGARAVARGCATSCGLESDAIWSDEGIIVHLPDADEPPGADMVLLDPETIEDQVVAELGASALFGARFRENAARALLIPRAYPGRRTPLWQQRLKAQSLLEVAKRYADFPIILETYRECLRDVLDVPGLHELLTKLHTRELSLVEVETPTASPFASALLFDYVATYMYEGDTPNAERRAAALSLDRDLLRELLGQDELRELIDPGALEALEDDLQHRSDRTRATSSDALGDVLRRVGDLTADEAQERVLAGLDAAGFLDDAAARAARHPRAGRRRGALDRRRRRGAVPRRASASSRPAACRRRSSPRAERPLEELLSRYARTHGPFTTGEVRARYGVDVSSALAAMEARGELIRGELRPQPLEPGREWCDPDVLRRIRRASLAVLREEIEAVDRGALAAFLPGWQGVDRHPPAGAGVDRLREVLVPLQGIALPADVWERDVLPRRLGAYSPVWMDQLRASGEVVWVGAGALGRNSGRVALYFRDDAAAIGRPGTRGPAAPPPADPVHEAIRERLARRPVLLHRPARRACAFSPEELQEALWDLAWAGEATNDAFAPLRAPRLTLARAQRARTASRAGVTALRRPPRRRRPGAGAGPLVAVGAAVRRGSRPARAAAHDRGAPARALRRS